MYGEEHCQSQDEKGHLQHHLWCHFLSLEDFDGCDRSSHKFIVIQMNPGRCLLTSTKKIGIAVFIRRQATVPVERWKLFLVRAS